jgi:glycosyltransferase involved in cell wall biosynthesis
VTVLALERDDIDVSASIADARAEGVELLVVRRAPSAVKDALSALANRKSYYAARYDNRNFARQLGRLGARPWALIQAEFSFMGRYRRIAETVPGLRGVPWVLDEHNIEWVISERLGRPGTATGRSAVYRLYRARELGLRKREELAACRQADRVLCVSAADAAVLATELPHQRFDVVPNGVEPDPTPFTPPPSDHPTAVFIGRMDYRPNQDGILWFFSEILPLVRERHPGFKLHVIGPQPPRLLINSKPAGVSIAGWVEDPRQWLREATMAVVPLRAGSGTRLKILEAMAVGRPVVSTTVGAEGIDIVPGRDFELADDAHGFAEAICRLIEDRGLLVKMASSGRAVAEQRYSWRHVLDALQRSHEDLGTAAGVPAA